MTKPRKMPAHNFGPQYEQENQEHLGVEFEWSDEQLRQAKAIARLAWHVPTQLEVQSDGPMNERVTKSEFVLFGSSGRLFEFMLTRYIVEDECYLTKNALHARTRTTDGSVV